MKNSFCLILKLNIHYGTILLHLMQNDIYISSSFLLIAESTARYIIDVVAWIPFTSLEKIRPSCDFPIHSREMPLLNIYKQLDIPNMHAFQYITCALLGQRNIHWIFRAWCTGHENMSKRAWRFGNNVSKDVARKYCFMKKSSQVLMLYSIKLATERAVYQH